MASGNVLAKDLLEGQRKVFESIWNYEPASALRYLRFTANRLDKKEKEIPRLGLAYLTKLEREKLREKILDLLETHGQLTIREISEFMNLPIKQIEALIGGLVRHGKVFSQAIVNNNGRGGLAKATKKYGAKK